MTRFFSTLFCIMTLAVGIRLYGQGRVDTDPILSDIRWTTQKIDHLGNLEKKVQIDSTSSGKSFRIYFYKSDTLCKVSELKKTSTGTQLTSYYFDKAKLTYISVDRNNFKLTENIQNLNKAVLSFRKESDTLTNEKPVNIEQYSASYYFYKDQIRFAAVVTYSDKGLVKNVRHDNTTDIKKGMKLYAVGKEFKRTYK